MALLRRILYKRQKGEHLHVPVNGITPSHIVEETDGLASTCQWHYSIVYCRRDRRVSIHMYLSMALLRRILYKRKTGEHLPVNGITPSYIVEETEGQASTCTCQWHYSIVLCIRDRRVIIYMSMALLHRIL